MDAFVAEFSHWKLGRRRALGSRGKRRTYVARKEEKAELMLELERLRDRLTQLQNPPTSELRVDLTRMEFSSRALRQVTETAAFNQAMHATIREQQLHAAGMQSLLSSQLMSRESPCSDVPFVRKIHLSKDVPCRHQSLRDLKPQVLNDAIQFMLARRQFLDLRRASHQADEFDTQDGDFMSIHWDVTPFFGASSVRDVYEELLFFMGNQEMSAMERLDAVTIRESDEQQILDVAQARLVTTLLHHQTGLTIEKNLAIFMQYFDSSSLLNEPHALMVVQPVAHDDLFPYHSGVMLRQDITAVAFLTAAPGSDCVSMTRWAAVRMHNGEYVAKNYHVEGQMNDEARDDFDATVRRAVHEWCDLMLTTMKERVRRRRAQTHG